MVARNVYDSNNMGRLKLFGAVLGAMQIDQSGRIAIVYVDHEMARAAGGTYEDTEGLVNLPLTVKEIEAVVFFKQEKGDEYRVSLRSKGDVDIERDRQGVRRRRAQECRRVARSAVRSKSCRRRSSKRSRTRSMDGLLVVDKPAGPTSHDVVARIRRALREKRIGHAGTLDPMATGVLLLVIGKATRLAKFLSASDKSYDAVIRFGFATDTADAQGRPLGPVSSQPTPSRDAIEAALDAFRGTFIQQPPAFSAKKIDGQRSYKLARDARRLAVAAPSCPSRSCRALPAPVRVTTHSLAIVATEGQTATLRVDCSAGFYVRSLAHDLGERLGVGAHLTALRRTRSGDFDLARGVELDTCERDPERAAAALVPLSRMLPGFPAALMTDEGTDRVRHGREIGPGHIAESTAADGPLDSGKTFVRLLDRAGELIAIAAANRTRRAFCIPSLFWCNMLILLD